MPNRIIVSFLTLCMSVIGCPNAPASPLELSPIVTSHHQPRTLFDFRRMDKVKNWIVVNDGVMGGKSKGGFKLQSGVLVFSGSTNTDGGGFSSIRGQLPKEADLADAAGLVIRLRTNGLRQFKVDVRQSGSARARSLSYRAPIKTTKTDDWQEVRIPFSAFAASWRGRSIRDAQLAPEAATQLGFFIYDGQDGPFRLEIESVSIYKPME